MIALHNTLEARQLDSYICQKVNPIGNSSLLRLIADYYYCTLEQAE